jgi:hypothetical protein
MLRGWQRYQHHGDARIRARYAREIQPLKTTYAAAVWAMRKWYGDNPPMLKKINTLLAELYTTFGWRTRLLAPLVGPYLARSMKKEAKRLAAGLKLEPPTFYELNPAAVALQKMRLVQDDKSISCEVRTQSFAVALQTRQS